MVKLQKTCGMVCVIFSIGFRFLSWTKFQRLGRNIMHFLCRQFGHKRWFIKHGIDFRAAEP
jgi:hypothetical protein